MSPYIYNVYMNWLEKLNTYLTLLKSFKFGGKILFVAITAKEWKKNKFKTSIVGNFGIKSESSYLAKGTIFSLTLL